MSCHVPAHRANTPNLGTLASGTNLQVDEFSLFRKFFQDFHQSWQRFALNLFLFEKGQLTFALLLAPFLIQLRVTRHITTEGHMKNFVIENCSINVKAQL